MMQPRLSICIPTFNFGDFIGATLESIVSQDCDDIEIVILDGGSNDNTEAVVDSFRAMTPHLRYFRQDIRGGIDRDMARVVELARGEYCWLFSADDTMRSGAIQRILATIKSKADVFVCGFMLCDREMKPIAPARVLRLADGEICNLSDLGSRYRYFAAADTTNAFFSFMGSLVFRRALWESSALPAEFVGSLWAHVVRFFRLIPRGLTVQYQAQILLDKRGDNDSFMDRGVVARIAIGIDGYHRIATEVFGDKSIEAFHIRRVVANEYRPRVLLLAKRQCRENGNTSDLATLDSLARKVYRDRTLRNLIARAAYRMMPLGLYSPIRRIYRMVRRWLRREGR